MVKPYIKSKTKYASEIKRKKQTTRTRNRNRNKNLRNDPSDSSESDSVSNSGSESESESESDEDRMVGTTVHHNRQKSGENNQTIVVPGSEPMNKSETDCNQYRVIQLQNGLRAILISTAASRDNDGRHRRNLRETSSNESEVPVKRSRPGPGPFGHNLNYKDNNNNVVTIRQAVEERMLSLVDECLMLAPKPVLGPETGVLVEGLIDKVKRQVKNFLAGLIAKFLDEFLPESKFSGVINSVSKPPEIIDTQPYNMASQLIEIIKTEIQNLIEEAKKKSAIELLLQVGQFSATWHLSEGVRQIIFAQIGTLIIYYLQQKTIAAITQGNSTMAGDGVEDETTKSPGSVGQSTSANPEKSFEEVPPPSTQEETFSSGSSWLPCGGIFGSSPPTTPTTPLIPETQTQQETESATNMTTDYSNSDNEKTSGWAEFGMMHLDIIPKDTVMERKIKTLDTSAVSLTIPSGSIQEGERFTGISDLCRRLFTTSCYLHPSATENTIFTTFTHLSSVEETKSADLRKMLKCVSKFLTGPKIEKLDIFEIIRNRDQGGMKTYKGTFDKSNPLTKKRNLHLLYSFVKFDHPLRFISPGCHEALRDTNLKVDEISEFVRNFWCKFYRIENATLAVQADEPLDIIQRKVGKYFGRIQNRAGSSSRLIGEPDPFDSSEFRRWVRVVLPKSNKTHSAILTWALPAESWKELEGIPLDYISHIFSYKGSGSLFNSLACRAAPPLIYSLAAGCPQTDYHRNDFCALFQIHFNLTKTGLQEFNLIIEEVFSYLKFINQNGPNPLIIQEVRTSNSMSFNSPGKPAIIDETLSSPKIPLVVSLSRAVQFGLPNVSFTSTVAETYNLYSEKIKASLDHLIPDNMNIMIFSKDFKALNCVVFRKERYFGTSYTSEKITEKLLYDWKNVQVRNTFSFPLTNSFNTQLLTSPEIISNDNSANNVYPVELVRNDRYVLWHNYNPRYKNMVTLNLNFSSPIPLNSAAESARLSLLIKALNNQLINEFYDSKIWNATLKLETTLTGFSLKISCHKNRFTTLVQAVICKIKNLEKSWSQEEFQHLKQMTCRDHESQMLNSTLISANLFQFLTRKYTWKITDVMAELGKMQLTHCDMTSISTFVEQFKSGVFLQALIMGNIADNEAMALMAEIQYNLQNEGSAQRLLENPLLQWRKGKDMLIKVIGFNPEECKTLISKYYQLGHVDLQSKVIAEIDIMISVILQKKNGFVRECWIPNFEMNIYLKEIQGMLFFQHDAIFTEADCSPKFVEKAMDEFISNFSMKVLKCLRTERFYDYCESALKSFHSKNSPSYIQEEFKCLAKEMDKFAFNELRFVEELCVYNSVELNTVRKWYDQNLLTNGCIAPSRLCIQVSPPPKIVGKNINFVPEPCIPNMITFQFGNLTCEEERKEWTPENVQGIYVKRINQYKNSLLAYQIPYSNFN